MLGIFFRMAQPIIENMDNLKLVLKVVFFFFNIHLKKYIPNTTQTSFQFCSQISTKWFVLNKNQKQNETTFLFTKNMNKTKGEMLINTTQIVCY